ncbi:MAG: PHP domain-containing protein [Candidatus Zixiibacteriota bacterium]|nr:MAG: PHP domain-containing protein [candidate division Zixibacteria bacterium]
MKSKVKLKGALHLHTTLSHDGDMSLRELVAFLKSKGYDYMAITEHSYDVDNELMADLSERAAALSDDDFQVIAGIEFRCHDYVDIIGYGVTRCFDNENPSAVIEHIKANDGVAVFAHPSIRDYAVDPAWVTQLDGCEVWNVTHEGKFVPRIKGIRRFQQLRAMNGDLMAFSGLDMHRKESYCYLSTTTYADGRSRSDILKAVREGSFRSESRLFSLNSRGEISALSRARISALGTVLNLLRWLRNMVRQ